MDFVLGVIGDILMRAVEEPLVLDAGGPISRGIIGFLPPFAGLGQVLALLASGVLSAQWGGRALRVLAATLAIALVVGFMLGLIGLNPSWIAYGIALSVSILGVALLIQRRLPEAVGVLSVGLFALCRGLVHGAGFAALEITMDRVAYLTALLTATLGLYVSGILLGYVILRRPAGSMGLSVVGGALVLVGVYLWL